MPRPLGRLLKHPVPARDGCAGDTKGIDDVIERVQLIVEPVETVMFDAFDQAHAPQWRALRARFFADNEEVKAATRELIDTSFRKLRSAEGAFELFQVGLPCRKPMQRTQHGKGGLDLLRTLVYLPD